MKKHFCLMALLVVPVVGRADLVFRDGFTYPDGNLVGAPGSPWNAHSGAGSSPVAVNGGRAGIVGGSGSREDVSVTLPGQPYTSSGPVSALFAGFTVRVTALPNAAGSYFAHFNAASNMRCRIWTSTSNSAPGSFRLGVGNGTGANASTGQLTTDLVLNTDYLIVVRYALSTGLSTIWLNPLAETDPGVTASDVPGTPLPNIVAFAIRQDAGMGSVLVDNLVIGTSFADVVGGNLPPTVSAIADQSIPANASTGPIPFAVGDDQTPAGDLVPTGSSDNQALVPDGNIIFGGAASARTVTVNPVSGQQGQANITVSVNDGATSSSTTFMIRVGAPGIDPIANQVTPVNTVFGPINLTVADAEESAESLTVTATSSHPLLVPNGNLSIGGAGGTRTLTAIPVTGTTGLTTITVAVSDGYQTAEQSFILTVHPVLGLLASDDFNRPDDFLVDWVNWISHSGPPGEILITGNRVPLTQQLAEDASLPLTPGTIYPADAGHVFYASFVANFSELPTGTGTYFAHFAHFESSPPDYRGRVFATVVGATTGTLRLGVTSGSNTVGAGSLHPLELALNTDYLVVTRLNTATGESRLWVNPSAEALGFVDSTDSPFPSAVESFAFRQSGPSPGMGVLMVDSLKVGTAFNDVVSNLPVMLMFTRNSNNLRLSWTAGQGFLLRRATVLPAAPAEWSNVPFVNEGANDVSNVDVATGTGFFRLEKAN